MPTMNQPILPVVRVLDAHGNGIPYKNVTVYLVRADTYQRVDDTVAQELNRNPNANPNPELNPTSQ